MSVGALTKKIPWRVLGALLAVASAVYFTLELVQRWPQIAKLPWSGAVVAGLVVAALLQTGAAAMEGVAWGWLLRALHVPATPRAALGICLAAQFAKYVPGNVAHHMGRIALSRQVRWPAGPVLLSMLVETGFTLGVGALMAATGVVLANAEGSAARLRLLGAVFLLAVGWVLGTLLLRRLLARPTPFLRKRLALQEPVVLRPRLLLGYSAVHLAGFLAMGIAVALLVAAVSGQWSSRMWVVPAAVSLAWLSGFVVPGAPAGLGVREAALTALLAPSLGSNVVVSAALLWRLSSLLADAVMFGIGLALNRSLQASQPESKHSA